MWNSSNGTMAANGEEILRVLEEFHTKLYKIRQNLSEQQAENLDNFGKRVAK